MESIYYYFKRYLDILQEPALLLIIILNIFFFIYAILVYRKYRKRILDKGIIDNDDLDKIKKIIWAYASLSILLSFINLPSFIEYLFYSPLILFLAALPTVIGLFIYFNFFIKNRNIELPNYSDKNKLIEAVDQIVNSSDFISAFRQTLPKCDEDTKSGIGHIRFILGIIEDKRKRYKIESDRYLKYIFTVGAISIVLVGSLGWIILDEDTVGFPRKINDLQKRSDEIANHLKIQEPILSQNTLFNSICGQYIDRLKENKSTDNYNKKIIEDVNSVINKFYLNNNLEYFITNLDSLRTRWDYNKEDRKSILDDIKKTYNAALEFKNSKEGSQISIYNSNREFEQLIQELRATYSKAENRIPEILKRLILSAVIVTFLIFVMRFLVNLYKNQYYQMILAEKQDLIARKFYVTFKGTDQNSDARKEAIIKFLVNEDVSFLAGNTKDNIIDMSLLKQLLEIFSKK